MREKEIDEAIENLVNLRDVSHSDDLTDTLKPAIKALQEFRRQRHLWKKSAKQLRDIQRLYKDTSKALIKLREALNGRR